MKKNSQDAIVLATLPGTPGIPINSSTQRSAFQTGHWGDVKLMFGFAGEIPPEADAVELPKEVVTLGPS